MSQGNPNPSPATRFAPGNPGRPVGTKNRQPGLEIKLKAIKQFGDKWLSLLGEMAESSKFDRIKFVELFARLLPRESLIEADITSYEKRFEDMTDDERRAERIRLLERIDKLRERAGSIGGNGINNSGTT